MSKKRDWSRSHQKPAPARSDVERLDQAASKLLYNIPKHPKQKEPTRFEPGTFGAAGPCVSVLTGKTIERSDLVPRPPTVKPYDRNAGPPSPAQVEAGKSAAGGWTRATLASWGIRWPPLRGWRDRIEMEFNAYHRARKVHAHQVDATERLKQADLPLPPPPDTGPEIPASTSDKPPWC